MSGFLHESFPGRVVLERGALDRVGEEATRLGLTRVLVIATRSQAGAAKRALAMLEDRACGFIGEVRMHVPVEKGKEALAQAESASADGTLAIGGGSAIGLAKWIARERGLPIIAVPTTYSGSEMTTIWGESEDGSKRTGRDPKVLPKVVLYDPDLTTTLPARASVASGLNAVAHAVEALYAERRSPLVALAAGEAIAAMAEALPAITADPADPKARERALVGAWLGGYCLRGVGMALHHKLCHTLGGLGLPHAETHAAVLPHAVAYNREAAPEAMAVVARALGRDDPAGGLFDLATKLGIEMRLEALGLAAADIDVAADRATESPYPNPRPIERDAVRELLQAAFEGHRP